MANEQNKDFNAMLHDSKDMPKIQVITDQKSIEKYGGDRMYFAPPIAYDAVMRNVPVGKVTTVGAIRAHFAKQNGADFTEPITAGIFVSIAAGRTSAILSKTMNPCCLSRMKTKQNKTPDFSKSGVLLYHSVLFCRMADREHTVVGFDRRAGQLLGDSAREAGQGFTRADFQCGGVSVGHHVLHKLFPADRRDHVLFQMCREILD